MTISEMEKQGNVYVANIIFHTKWVFFSSCQGRKNCKGRVKRNDIRESDIDL